MTSRFALTVHILVMLAWSERERDGLVTSEEPAQSGPGTASEAFRASLAKVTVAEMARAIIEKMHRRGGANSR